MSADLRQQLLTLGKRIAALFGLAVLFAGCGPPSAQQRSKGVPGQSQGPAGPSRSLRGNGDRGRQAPVNRRVILLVVLNDMQHPQDPSKQPKLRTGRDQTDISLLRLMRCTTASKQARTSSRSCSYFRPNIGRQRNSMFKGPDELKNLYNDPDKNAEIPEFKIDLKPPGIKDAHFNLTVEGKEPVTTPGPHAITSLDTR